MALITILLAGLAGDALFGELRRGHPLIVFGGWADRLERRFNDGRVRSGALAWLMLVALPSAALALFVAVLPSVIGWMIAAGVLYLSIGRRAMIDHVRPVATALIANDLVAARRATGRLVSRETGAMDGVAVRRATIESVLENSSDAIIAPLVWAALGSVFGPAGAAAAVLAHRLINTLDAMWGYRSARFERFGRVAARADDWMNGPAARATAWVFVAWGGAAARRCWRTQATRCASPNAGPVMCAGAGALDVTLGGPAIYHGAWQNKPEIGTGRAPVDGDIDRALRLVDRAVASVVVLVAIAALLAEALS